MFEGEEVKTRLSRGEKPRKGTVKNDQAAEGQGQDSEMLGSQAEAGGHDFIGNGGNCRFCYHEISLMEGEAQGLPYPQTRGLQEESHPPRKGWEFHHGRDVRGKGRRSREDPWSESGQQQEYADHMETEKLRRSGQKEKALPSTLDKLMQEPSCGCLWGQVPLAAPSLTSFQHHVFFLSFLLFILYWV